MAKKLTVEFAGVRTAKQIVDDLKFTFEWKSAELFMEHGKPCVRYRFEDGDGYTGQRTRSLLDLDAIVEECNEDGGSTNVGGESFNEIYDYVYSVWGKDAKGNWYLGYEG